MSGTLFLCATPIGNLGDVTKRTLETLREVDIIACEDTRNSRKLFSHFGIPVTSLTKDFQKTRFPEKVQRTQNSLPSSEVESSEKPVTTGRKNVSHITAYHDHNRYEKAYELVSYLKQGLNVALITDAGMPAISDPGYELVKLCHEEQINVTALPGACALVTALAVSGINPRRFVFEGFLPADNKARAHILEALKNEERTLILYEAPHHLKKTLADLAAVLGGRECALCRELTKKFEDVTRTTLGEALSFYEKNEPRGEYVLVIEGKDPKEIKNEKAAAFKEMSVEEHVRYYEEKGFDRKEAIKSAARDLNVPKREVYNALQRPEA